MVPSQRIVVSNDAARLWAILIVMKYSVRQVGKLSIVFFNVKNVRIQIHVLIPEGIDFSQLLEPIKCNIIVQRSIACMRYLVDNIDTVWEVFDQSTIEVDAVSLLPDIQVVVGVVEVVHPVILTGASLQKSKDLPAVVTLSNKGTKL